MEKLEKSEYNMDPGTQSKRVKALLGFCMDWGLAELGNISVVAAAAPYYCGELGAKFLGKYAGMDR